MQFKSLFVFRKCTWCTKKQKANLSVSCFIISHHVQRNLSFTRQIFFAQKKKKNYYRIHSRFFKLFASFKFDTYPSPGLSISKREKKERKWNRKKVRVNAARPITFPSGVIAGFGCNQRDTRDLSRIFHPASSTKRRNLIGLHRHHCSIPKSP